LESRGYYSFDTKALRAKMLELKEEENGDIVIDFVKNTLKDEYASDSDMLYIDENKIQKDYSQMAEYYEQKCYEEYLQQLEIEI
jgi:hypothetical protein